MRDGTGIQVVFVVVGVVLFALLIIGIIAGKDEGPL